MISLHNVSDRDIRPAANRENPGTMVESLRAVVRYETDRHCKVSGPDSEERTTRRRTFGSLS